MHVMYQSKVHSNISLSIILLIKPYNYKRAKIPKNQSIFIILVSQIFSSWVKQKSLPLQYQPMGKMVKRWTEGQSHFPVGRRAPRVRPRTFPKANNNMYKKNAKKVWNNNTHLSVDLKTQLRSDHYMKPGKSYQGVLRRDIECDEFLYGEHFTFVETEAPATGKRNPHVFRGKHITITRRDDGTYRPNFRPVSVGAGFNVGRYAAGVANELLWALEGLVGEE